MWYPAKVCLTMFFFKVHKWFLAWYDIQNNFLPLGVQGLPSSQFFKYIPKLIEFININHYILPPTRHKEAILAESLVTTHVGKKKKIYHILVDVSLSLSPIDCSSKSTVIALFYFIFQFLLVNINSIKKSKGAFLTSLEVSFFLRTRKSNAPRRRVKPWLS